MSSALKKELVICFFIPGFKGGGAEKQCILLLNSLQHETDLQLHLVYFEKGILFDELKKDNLRLWKINSKSFYNPVNIWKVNLVFQKIKPDIIFSWILVADIYTYLAKKICGNFKWIMSERNSNYPITIKYWLRRKIGVKADLIIANSNKGAEYWLKYGVKEKLITVIPNILQISSPERKIRLKGNPTLMYAGRFEDQKNILVLTNAFCDFIEYNNLAKAYIIGEGSLKDDIIALIERRGKQNSVYVLPFKKNIIEYFKSTDIFVNISKREGMPNTVIENIGLKNKILVSRIDEHIEILGQDYPYLIKNFNNSKEVFKMLKLLSDEKDISELLVYGTERLKCLTSSKITRMYKYFFKSLQS